jgi:hypothetical protein
MRLSFHSDGWDWGGAEREWSIFRRRMSTVARGFAAALVDVELTDGWVELELAVGPERSFHGVVWRAADDRNYESFFVRPHQVGNPDAVQYTPVTNGISSWQLYHGDGFWAPLAFPVRDWFRIRVDFAGARAEVRIGDLSRVALVCPLKVPRRPGRIGVLVAGPDVHLGELAFGEEAEVDPAPPPAPAPPEGVIRAWEVSDAFPEEQIERARTEPRSWTPIESEPGGLLDLARVQGIEGDRNTVLARAPIQAARAGTRALQLGFSDRALAYLNGLPLYRGDDTYRSRDYRFLGSIGWYDTVYLPLDAGENELVVAVSEDVGGWGVQARVVD